MALGTDQGNQQKCGKRKREAVGICYGKGKRIYKRELPEGSYSGRGIESGGYQSLLFQQTF